MLNFNNGSENSLSNNSTLSFQVGQIPVLLRQFPAVSLTTFQTQVKTLSGAVPLWSRDPVKRAAWPDPPSGTGCYPPVCKCPGWRKSRRNPPRAWIAGSRCSRWSRWALSRAHTVPGRTCWERWTPSVSPRPLVSRTPPARACPTEHMSPMVGLCCWNGGDGQYFYRSLLKYLYFSKHARKSYNTIEVYEARGFTI